MISHIFPTIAFRRFLRFVAVALTAICLSVSPTMTIASTVEPLLQYQGLLTDPNTGDPIEGQVMITFQIFKDEDGSDDPSWEEDHELDVERGLVSVVLGQRARLSETLFRGDQLWLGIIVNETKLDPRQPLLPTAFALRSNSAANADRLEGLQASSFLRSQGPLTIPNNSTSSTLTLSQPSGDAPALSVVGSVVAESYKFDKPRTGYIFIGSHSFGTSNHTVRYQANLNGAYITGWEGNAPVGLQSLRAPIQLPHGAVVTEMRVWMDDNTTDGELRVSLLSQAPPSSAGFLRIDASSSDLGDDPYVDATPASGALLINNETMNYYISATATGWHQYGGDLRVRGVRLTYTIDEM